MWLDHGTGYLTIEGKLLEYSCLGPHPKQAPTIVLLHEGLGCLALWKDFPVQLHQQTGFGVLAYSRCGYGNSDFADMPRPLNYMHIEALEVLPAVLDAVEFERGILLGHSDGASIAAIYAGSIEDSRVQGLVLMAPHFFVEESGLEAIELVKHRFYTQGLKQRMDKYHRDAAHTFKVWNDSWLHPNFRDWNISHLLSQIEVPVLAVQGCEDEFGTIAQIFEIQNRSRFPVEVSMLLNCKHSPHLEYPEMTITSIKNYICKYGPLISNQS